LQTNTVLFPEQFGFRTGISLENAAFKLTNSALRSINQKMHVGGILCDLQKLLICVNHGILLTKLLFLCVFKGQKQVWFRSYH
jgi:hypothetical protein